MREPRATRSDLDARELELLTGLLERIEQGDVVHVAPVAALGAPPTSRDPEVAAARDLTDEPVVAVARTSALGLHGVITQRCDIVRALEDEPFLHLCPLVEVSETDWEASREGRYSVRRFGYPSAIEGRERLALDVRIVQTIEKTALLDGSLRPVPSGMSSALRSRFAEWLGMRFARHAFPDDLERHVLRDLRAQLRDKVGASSPSGDLVRSLEGVWIKHADSPMVMVLLVLNTGRAQVTQLRGDAATIAAAAESLVQPIRKRIEKAGSGYQIQVEVRTPTRVTAFDLLYDYRRLR